jgi:hypothetical protein
VDQTDQKNFEFTVADDIEFVPAIVQVPHGIEALGPVFTYPGLKSSREVPGARDDQVSLGPSSQVCRTLGVTPEVVDWATPETEAIHESEISR